VKLAGRYGVSRTARALGVGYYSLKDRVEKETVASVAGSPTRSEGAFLELAVSPRSSVGECILEWEDAGGGKMRVHLKGVAAPDLVALSRSFWEGRR
jgi:predicted SpoU family rRNA methylase